MMDENGNFPHLIAGIVVVGMGRQFPWLPLSPRFESFRALYRPFSGLIIWRKMRGPCCSTLNCKSALSGQETLSAEKFVHHRWDKNQILLPINTLSGRKLCSNQASIVKIQALFLEWELSYSIKLSHTRCPSTITAAVGEVDNSTEGKGHIVSIIASHRKTPLPKTIEKAKDFLHE